MKNFHCICLLTIILFFQLPLYGQVWNYDVPGGSEFSSPDYTVSIEQDGVAYPSFVHSSDSVHTTIKGMRFENISVNSPVIFHRSVIGSAYDNAVSDFNFVNLKINGTVVTEENKDDFFEIETNRVQNVSFSK